MKAILIEEFGGPEVLKLKDIPAPPTPPGGLLIEVSRAGVNYADTHQAENSYLAPAQLPLVPGAEVVGVVSDGPADWLGRRVVALVNGGGYAAQAVTTPALAFPIPDGVGDAAALALVLQGSTAWHLLRTSGHLAAGETVVVHAGAGGVGSLAVQLAKRWGAGRVIATASSEAKRDLARRLGADETVDANTDDMTAALRAANGGAPVDIVLEMTGGRIFDESLKALAPFGRLVTYGMASRRPGTPLTAAELMSRSRAVIGFWLAHCFTRPAMMSAAMDELIALTAAGSLCPVVGGEYPLSQAREAHEAIRSRATTGKLVLDPAG
ncbi:MAG TPA: NADPH:quinone oxidoreductase family protein [Mycobacteriales bacterium]|nr:NADPH:quinone oxidoreductase family protein [Mycobacteriales bacterium]